MQIGIVTNLFASIEAELISPNDIAKEKDRAVIKGL